MVYTNSQHSTLIAQLQEEEYHHLSGEDWAVAYANAGGSVVLPASKPIRVK